MTQMRLTIMKPMTKDLKQSKKCRKYSAVKKNFIRRGQNLVKKRKEGKGS